MFQSSKFALCTIKTIPLAGTMFIRCKKNVCVFVQNNYIYFFIVDV